MSRRIELTIFVAAPIERCFDLARDVDAHTTSTPGTNERAVAGRTSGLFELHDEVTWEAVHFGVRQRLTSRITAFERPTHFRDSMVRGAFARFDHDPLLQRGKRRHALPRHLRLRRPARPARPHRGANVPRSLHAKVSRDAPPHAERHGGSAQ